MSRELDELIRRGINQLPSGDALAHIGALIDAAYDERSREGTDRALSLLDSLREDDLTPDQACLLHYFRANAWENRRQEKIDHDVWAWEQPEIGVQILELRRAVRHEGFSRLPNLRKCQILTNLANQLNSIGRFVEAIALWDRALLIEERFAMALGNRGIGINHYARSLYDTGHAAVMLVTAFDSLTAATSAKAIFESADKEVAHSKFLDFKAQISELVDVEAARSGGDLHDHSLGESAEECSYRAWCLDQRLFINPLNDLGAIAIAGRDVLTLPSLSTFGPSSRIPPVIGFFNQLKQEFVSARYFYYEGKQSNSVHFSDRGVLLYNTLDYPAYSLATERMRAAFRVAYSLFDKIGYFLNAYLQTGHNSNRVTFKNFWYQTKGNPPPLLERFESSQNWPFRGLFWLSKDLFEEEFKLVTDPDAEAIAEMRNHLEHKYLHLNEGSGGMSAPAEFCDEYKDLLVYGLSKHNFSAKTLRLLKLVREALIYLSLAVHREESARAAAKDDRPIFSEFLDRWEDDWKL